VALLFRSRRTVLRGLFDVYLFAGGEEISKSGEGGGNALKLVWLDEAFGGHELLSVKGCVEMVQELGIY